MTYQVDNYTEQGGAKTVIGGEIDITGTLKKASVEITASAAELNLNDKDTVQNLVADGAITVKNGVCLIAKTEAGVVAATLANPTATTDDYKRLLIISNQAEANTVTLTGGFGNGGAGEDVCTFSGAVGDCIELMAYGAKWYVVGGHQFTLT